MWVLLKGGAHTSHFPCTPLGSFVWAQMPPDRMDSPLCDSVLLATWVTSHLLPGPLWVFPCFRDFCNQNVDTSASLAFPLGSSLTDHTLKNSTPLQSSQSQ